MSSPSNLLKIRDVADQLQVSVYTVRSWAKKGTLPSVRITPKTIRFRPADVERHLATLSRSEVLVDG